MHPSNCCIASLWLPLPDLTMLNPAAACMTKLWDVVGVLCLRLQESWWEVIRWYREGCRLPCYLYVAHWTPLSVAFLAANGRRAQEMCTVSGCCRYSPLYYHQGGLCKMRTADCTTGKIGLEVGVLYTRESAFKPIVRSADPQICSPHFTRGTSGLQLFQWKIGETRIIPSLSYTNVIWGD